MLATILVGIYWGTKNELAVGGFIMVAILACYVLFKHR